MSIQEAFDRIKKRNTPLDVFRAALERKGLPSPGRWQVILNELNEKKGALIAIIDRENKLKEIYNDLVRYGDKAIQIAEFDESHKASFETIHQAIFKTENDSTEYFHDISDTKLKALPTYPVLAKVVTSPNGLVKTLFFMSQEIRRTREDIKYESAFLAFPALLGYTTLYGVKEENFLRVDIVIIDIKKRTFEFRADATGAGSPDVLRDYLEDLKKYFRKVLVANIGDEWSTTQFSLRNLFPKIDKMYNEKSAGDLSAIGYNTPFGAKNLGVMRGKGDLKQDPSHIASMGASLTEIYYITKTYGTENPKHSIRLSIPGKTSDVGVENPKLYTAIIENCYNDAQFGQMLDKLQ